MKAKKKRREEEGAKKGMETNLEYGTMNISMDLWNFCMDFYDFWYGSLEICMDTCLWVVGCNKPNPRINSYGIKSMESFL